MGTFILVPITIFAGPTTLFCGFAIFSFTHIVGITPGADDEVDEVGVRANEGKAAGVYGTGLGARDGMWGPGIKVGSDKELTEVGRMAESGVVR